MSPRSAALATRASIDRQGLVLAAVARVGVEFARLGVLIAGGFGEMLGLDGLSLCLCVSLACLGGAFLGFGVSALCFGGLRVGGGAGAFGLNRAASGLLAKFACVFAVTSSRLRPAARAMMIIRISATTTAATIMMIVPVLMRYEGSMWWS